MYIYTSYIYIYIHIYNSYIWYTYILGMYGTRYEVEVLQQCGKRVKTKSQKVLGLVQAFVEVTVEKLVGSLVINDSILKRL